MTPAGRPRCPSAQLASVGTLQGPQLEPPDLEPPGGACWGSQPEPPTLSSKVPGKAVASVSFLGTLKEKVGDFCWESKALSAAGFSRNPAGPSAGTSRLGALRRSQLGLSAGASPLPKGAWEGGNLWVTSAGAPHLFASWAASRIGWVTPAGSPRRPSAQLASVGTLRGAQLEPPDLDP